jgi:integrase
MAKRRGNSEGTIYPHPTRGEWVGQVTVGRHPVSGKPVRKTVYGATRKEVVEKLDKVRQNPTLSTSSQKLSTAIEYWLAGHKLRVDPATAVCYESDLRPVKERVGHVELKDLSAKVVQDLYRRMEAEGLSPSAQRRAGSRLRQVLAACVRAGMIASNPASACPLPRARAEAARALRPEEVARLLKVADAGPLGPMVRLALDTGARQGELWALTFGDFVITPEGPEVVISKSLQERDGKLRVKEPKTRGSRRKVPILRRTLEAVGTVWPAKARPEDLVFRNSDGQHLRKPNFIRRHWQPLLKAAGLEGLKFHSLRHTCATLLLTANVHPKIVQERLGHASITITLDTYSHLIPAMQSRAVEALGRTLGEEGA